MTIVADHHVVGFCVGRTLFRDGTQRHGNLHRMPARGSRVSRTAVTIKVVLGVVVAQGLRKRSRWPGELAPLQ